jgi:hypothetical protein
MVKVAARSELYASCDTLQPQEPVDASITSKTAAHYCCHACQFFVAVLQAESATAA